jgi:hypothetical protein
VRRLATRPLWLGHAGDARDISGLHALGIVAVVDLAHEESPAAVGRDLTYLRFPISDGADNPRWLLRTAVGSVARLIGEHVPTLVACGAGMSRSPAIIAAALARAEGCPMEECLAEVAAGGPCDISPELWRDLILISS